MALAFCFALTNATSTAIRHPARTNIGDVKLICSANPPEESIAVGTNDISTAGTGFSFPQ